MHTLGCCSICHPWFGPEHGEKPVKKHLTWEKSSITFVTSGSKSVSQQQAVGLIENGVSKQKVLSSSLPLTLDFFCQEPRADLTTILFPLKSQ